MRAWRRRVAALEAWARAPRQSAHDPAPAAVEQMNLEPWPDGINGMSWLGLPGLAVTQGNFGEFCEVLTNRQMADLRRYFAAGIEGSDISALRPPRQEPDIEIQAALMRAGHIRQFPRLGWRTIDPEKLTSEEMADLRMSGPTERREIDLSKLTADELAALNCGGEA